MPSEALAWAQFWGAKLPTNLRLEEGTSNTALSYGQGLGMHPLGSENSTENFSPLSLSLPIFFHLFPSPSLLTFLSHFPPSLIPPFEPQ